MVINVKSALIIVKIASIKLIAPVVFRDIIYGMVHVNKNVHRGSTQHQMDYVSNAAHNV
jgi:hypothetical protein